MGQPAHHQAIVDLLHGELGMEELEAAGLRDPSAPVLCRARLQIDVAIMLAQRFWSVEDLPFYMFPL